MQKKSDIKFGTDGWRAIIAQEFTVNGVQRVSEAVAKWLIKKYDTPTIVIGHDCRFGGELFLKTAKKVFTAYGIKVFYHKGISTTPMVSLGVKKLAANLGVVITASHNPPEYNGYKLKGNFGGPLLPADIAEIENQIPEQTLSKGPKQNLEKQINLLDIYTKHVENNFNLQTIANTSLKFSFCPMYGAGQAVMPKLLPGIANFNSEWNPLFGGKAPEPILKNLTNFQKYNIANKIDSGLAVDGDADRIGLFDEKGRFVDSHHIILLLIHYLVKYKKMTGKVVIAFSVSEKVKTLAAHYNLQVEVTKIGFKYIAGIMLEEDVLLGGEESGGIAIKGHIPERDGIWMGLILWEFMAKTGKSLSALINEVYAITGPMVYDRKDLHLMPEQKKAAIEKCKTSMPSTIGDEKVKEKQTIDGFKYLMDNDAWLLIRPSGTEPVLRIYAETPSAGRTSKLLNAAVKMFVPS